MIKNRSRWYKNKCTFSLNLCVCAQALVRVCTCVCVYVEARGQPQVLSLGTVHPVSCLGVSLAQRSPISLLARVPLEFWCCECVPPHLAFFAFVFVNYIYLLCVWRMPWCAFDYQKVILSWTVWLRLVWSTQDSSLKKFSKLSWCSNCLRFVSGNHFKISPGSLCHNPILFKVSSIEPDVYLASCGLNYFFKVVQSRSLISNFFVVVLVFLDRVFPCNSQP